MFENFRNDNNLCHLWPVPIADLINFIIYLCMNGYSPSTAKTYISAIGFKMKISNFSDTTESFLVKKLLTGMTKKYKTTDVRKPITVKVLSEMLKILPNICLSYYEANLFAAIFSLAFFAFLRIGEIVESGKAYHVVQRKDISLNNTNKSIKITLNTSKTDQFGKGTNLIVTNNSDDISVHSILKNYLALRPKMEGALFCHLNKKLVTRFQVTKVLKSALHFLGYQKDDFNTHSFRIGAATHAYNLGKSDEEIMMMGRWKSNSYKKYIRSDISL